MKHEKLFNPDLKFDEKSHTYWLDSDKSIKFDSVTTFIGTFFETFNAPAIAANLVKNHPKYQHMTVGELLREWQKSGTHGTKVHNEIEGYIKGDLDKSELTEKKAEYGVEFIDEKLDLSKYDLFPEVKVASVKYQLSGMVDLLAYDPATGRYVIADWKTNKKITTSSYRGKTGIKPPTYHIEDCKYNLYALQMSLYRYILEEEYGLDTIRRQVLIHLKDSGRTIYHTPYMKKEIESMLNYRMKNK